MKNLTISLSFSHVWLTLYFLLLSTSSRRQSPMTIRRKVKRWLKLYNILPYGAKLPLDAIRFQYTGAFLTLTLPPSPPRPSFPRNDHNMENLNDYERQTNSRSVRRLADCKLFASSRLLPWTCLKNPLLIKTTTNFSNVIGYHQPD